MSGYTRVRENVMIKYVSPIKHGDLNLKGWQKMFQIPIFKKIMGINNFITSEHHIMTYKYKINSLSYFSNILIL